jgi:hypothetical protein
MKMKMAMTKLAKDGGQNAVVMVITGDVDFVPELQQLKRAGYYTILLHWSVVCCMSHWCWCFVYLCVCV